MKDTKDFEYVEVGYPEAVSGSGLPKRLSANALLLCGAEWSWSPGNSRADRYSLHSGRKDWFLWLSYYDDYSERIERYVIGRMPKKGVDAFVAAKTLLCAFWRFDFHESEVDRPHYCDPGFLSTEALEEIAEAIWGVESVISPELIEAYERTDFRVLEPRKFTLRIGEHSSELADLYLQMGVKSAAYLTAWNPDSRETSEDQNRRGQDNLRKKLSLEGLPTLNAIGINPSGEWPGEESMLVPGLSLERAKALGSEFGQNAIVWAASDATPKLILLR